MGKLMRIMGLGAGVAAIAAVAAWGVADRAGGAPGQAPTSAAGAPRPNRPVIPPMVLGMNLGSPAYYSPEWAFADLFKNNADFSFEGEQKIPGLDAGGRPRGIAAGTVLNLAVDSGAVWRTGRYDCRVSPGWAVASRFHMPALVAQKGETFRLTIPVRQPDNAVHLALRAEKDGATLDDLACRPADRPAALLDPAFVADMRPFRVIRFMDWMRTNNLDTAHWADRPLPGDISIVPRGASVEDMVAVANEIGADPWFTLPFHADDDYVRRFATYVRDHLAPGRKAYVELSNEVWNGAFKQSKDALAAGKARYPGKDDQQATDFYYADRVRETMAIWAQVFAGHMDRLVRVAASQHVWSERAAAILGHADTWKSVDALATAPYFGVAIQELPQRGAARVDAVFALLPGKVEETITQGVRNKAIADRYGLRYLTYEGGPDIAAYTPEARPDMQAINRDPRIYAIYSDFLAKWQARIGGMLVLYQGTNTTTYGHLDHTGQPLAEAPKMRALADFAKALPPSS